MSIEKIYTPALTAKECVDTVRTEGGVLLRRFTNQQEQDELASEVLSHELTPVDRSQHTIPEQFHDIGWQGNNMPPRVLALGRRVRELVQSELPTWCINSVRAQLYRPGEVGIDWHRDYLRDLQLIAVMSLIKKAQFDIKLNSGEVRWTLEPGDLVLMRGTLLNGNVDDRPRHRVAPPEDGQRLSIAYRMESQNPPVLEVAS